MIKYSVLIVNGVAIHQVYSAGQLINLSADLVDRALPWLAERFGGMEQNTWFGSSLFVYLIIGVELLRELV